MARGRLDPILRAYGFVGNWPEERVDEVFLWGARPETYSRFGLQIHEEKPFQLYLEDSTGRKWFRGHVLPVYHALLPHLSFGGHGVEPVWVNAEGRATAAWLRRGDSAIFLLGLDVEEEIIRHRQGDPVRAQQAEVIRSGFGFAFERPNYLFEEQKHPDYPSEPWADRLGFLLAETLARLSGRPLAEVLPHGARGAVLLTGDDDQAYLESYESQLKEVGSASITYFLHHQTRHTAETIKRLPGTVEFGLHPDALDRPEAYDELCREQYQKVCSLVGRPIRLVRNHGYLNSGYLGHLKTWEKNGLALDANIPGVDGTALNGSFLPMRVRRPDGTWSDHYSLLTPFGDGMVFALGMTEKQAVRRIRKLAGQIEARHSGVLVFNLHPQNIGQTRLLHQETLRLAHRKGWLGLGMESYLNWLLLLEELDIETSGGRVRMRCPRPVEGLVLRYRARERWRRQEIPAWRGELEVTLA